jgi:hypothetical protein
MCVAPASAVINYAGGNANAVAPTSEIPVRPMAMGWPQPGQPQSYQLGIQWSPLSGPIMMRTIHALNHILGSSLA